MLEVARALLNSLVGRWVAYELIRHHEPAMALITETELEELLQLVVDRVQEKAWDCDIEATKQYWREKIEPVWEEREKAGHESRAEDGLRPYVDRHHGWYHWYYYHHDY